MIRVLHTFLNFCYLACHNVLDTQSLAAMQDALNQFHQYREVFHMCRACSSFNLPCQHSLMHFIQMIWAFGAPKGLCSSITELKQLKNPIEDQVIMKLSVRCYWLTNIWTNLQQCKSTSRGMVCWVEPAYHICFSLSANLVSLNAYSNSYHSDQPIIQLGLEQILMKVMVKMGQLQETEGMKTTMATMTAMTMRGVMRMRMMGPYTLQSLPMSS